jgi:hypothetical protein
MQKRFTLPALAGAIVGLALIGAFSSAGAARAATCPPPPTPLHPFTPWGDGADYVLTTGGSFEGGGAWALSGGAAVVAGDSAQAPLDAASDSHALSLPAGSSATSACVTAPGIQGVVRLFAKSAAAAAQLKVEVLVKGKVYDAGVVTAGSMWAPSPVLVSGSPSYSGAVTYQVRLTALSGGVEVDDVYLDPYKSK